MWLQMFTKSLAFDPLPNEGRSIPIRAGCLDLRGFLRLPTLGAWSPVTHFGDKTACCAQNVVSTAQECLSWKHERLLYPLKTTRLLA